MRATYAPGTPVFVSSRGLRGEIVELIGEVDGVADYCVEIYEGLDPEPEVAAISDHDLSLSEID